MTPYRFTTNGFPRWRHSRMTVVSSGWTTTSYPTHAELEVAGAPATVPATSYQRATIDLRDGAKDFFDLYNNGSESLSITGGDLNLNGVTATDLLSPLCSSSRCVVLVAVEKGYELSFTTYGADPGKLPDKQDFSVVLYDTSGTKVGSEALTVEFDAEVTAVFAVELEFDGDPNGGDASGSVSLLGAADLKGRQATLSKGIFYASFSRDSDGDLALDGYGADESATSDTGDSVLLGQVLGLTDREGNPLPPPAIQYGNGSGTKAAATTTSATPELL